MKTVLTAEAISVGGRSVTISSPDGVLDLKLGNPLEPGSKQNGPNPELLFAGAYSACFHGALKNAAKKAGHRTIESEVRAVVNLLEEDGGGYRLGVELHAQIAGVDHDETERIMAAAHQTCPYSKALRGDATVQLIVDEISAAAG